MIDRCEICGTELDDECQKCNGEGCDNCDDGYLYEAECPNCGEIHEF